MTLQRNTSSPSNALTVACVLTLSAAMCCPSAPLRAQTMTNGEACTQALGYLACSGQLQSPHQGPAVGYDPCYLAQNAMRPCTKEQAAPAPVGVDPTLVGTWELMVPNPLGVSRWVWEIRRDGTYSFRADGPGAAPAHSGTFAASKGHYALNSTTTSWNDVGTYQLGTHTTLVATGRLGTGTWQRITPRAATTSTPKATGAAGTKK